MCGFKDSVLTGRVLSLGLNGFGEIQSNDSALNRKIPFVIEGEEIEFHNEANNSLKEFIVAPKIINPSKFRINPVCKHYTKCGGCFFQHLSFEYYKEFKTNIILQLLDESRIKFAECEAKFFGEGLRRRAKRYLKKYNNKVVFGLYKLRGFCIENIKYCNVIRAELNNIADQLRQVMNQVMCDKQCAVVNLLLASNAIDIGIELEKQNYLSNEQKNILKNFGEISRIGRIQFRGKKYIENVHFTAEPHVIFGGYEVPVNSWCFLQPSFESEEYMVRYVLDALGSSKKIADLFSGRGTFSLPMSKINFVDAYEMDNGSIEALETVILRNKLKSIAVYKRNLFTKPLNVDELAKYDAVVVNPPRSGAEIQMQFIGSSDVNTVVYISCDLQSFLRDVKIAFVGGYTMSKLLILGQFLWSQHIELIAIMHK